MEISTEQIQHYPNPYQTYSLNRGKLCTVLYPFYAGFVTFLQTSPIRKYKNLQMPRLYLWHDQGDWFGYQKYSFGALSLSGDKFCKESMSLERDVQLRWGLDQMQHFKWTSSLYWQLKTENYWHVIHSLWWCHKIIPIFDRMFKWSKAFDILDRCAFQSIYQNFDWLASPILARPLIFKSLCQNQDKSCTLNYFLWWGSNFLASTRTVTAMRVCVCSIVCLCDCVMVIPEPLRK